MKKRAIHSLREHAAEVLRIEAEGILGLIDRLGPEFDKAVETILESKGRVILTGMGKSGLVARKVSATLNSTGTPSLFLHPAEAIHGDLGMVTENDIVLAISNSGETAEINMILPILRKMGAKIISLTGRPKSPMGAASDVVIDVGVEREACPLGLAPTASTTAALAMGDALAVALISRRSFKQEDFRRFHPGGTLGERLGIKVKEIMLTGARIPSVPLEATARRAIEEIHAKKIGATLVVNKDRGLAGIVTDGDLRRALVKQRDVHGLPITDIMSSSPKTLDQDQTAAEAMAIMELYGITHLVVLDRYRKVKGIVHLHDLLGREEFRAHAGNRRTPGSHR